MSKRLIKKIERHRNSIEELTNFAKEINKNAWSLTYMYPEDFGPAQYPDSHAFPTTISTNRFIRQFKVNSQGDFIIFYSPVSETFASYFNPAKTINNTLDRGTLTEYITYADSNGTDFPLTGSILKNASTWSYNLKPAPKFQHLRMIRLIGASLELFVTDVQKNHQGTIEAGMSFLVAGSGIQPDQVNPDLMQNMSNHVRFTSKDAMIFRYRIPNNNFMEFGPYEPFAQVPYFIIKGRGLSPTATVGVVVTNHVEGVFWPELSHFSYKPKMPQVPGENQRANINDSPDTGVEAQEGIDITERTAQTSTEIGGVKFFHAKESVTVEALAETLPTGVLEQERLEIEERNKVAEGIEVNAHEVTVDKAMNDNREKVDTTADNPNTEHAVHPIKMDKSVDPPQKYEQKAPITGKAEVENKVDITQERIPEKANVSKVNLSSNFKKTIEEFAKIATQFNHQLINNYLTRTQVYMYDENGKQYMIDDPQVEGAKRELKRYYDNANKRIKQA